MYSKNQLEIFKNDPKLIELSQPQSIRFTGCLFGKESEKLNSFLQCINEKRLPIVFPINGTNLDLKLSSVKIENDIYFFESNLILNSCYVEFKGKISKSTLTGQGQFVFDQDTAVNIAKTSNESIEPYQKRIETIQNLILK